MKETAEELAKWLEDRGVDPTELLTQGLSVSERVAGDDEGAGGAILGRLARLLAWLHEHGIDAWGTFRFGVAGLVAPAGRDVDVFNGLVDRLERLAAALVTAKLDVGLALSRLAHSLRAVGERAWLAAEVLDVATSLAARGVDPSATLSNALPALIEAAGDDAVRFRPMADGMRDAVLAMSARGVAPTLPIADGLAAITRAWQDDDDGMREAFAECAELAITLLDAGITPHPVFERGLVEGLRGARGAWWRAEVLPLGGAVAWAGGDPRLALARVGALGRLAPERARSVATRLRALAESRLDVARMLSVLPVLADVAGDDDGRFDALREATEALLAALLANGHRAPQTFDDGLPRVLSAPQGRRLAGRVLALSRRLAEAGIDPGPVLQYGLASAFETIAELWPDADDVLAEAALEGAERIFHGGQNPRRFLGAGVSSAARVAGGDPVVFVRLLGEIGEVARALRSEHILEYAIYNMAIGLRGELGVGVFTAALRALREFVPFVETRGMDPGGRLGAALGEVAETAQHLDAMWLVATATDVGRRLAERGVPPAPMLHVAVPAIAGATSIQGDRAQVEPLLAEIVACAKPGYEEVVEACCREVPDAVTAVRAALRLLRDRPDAIPLAVAAVPSLARAGALETGLPEIARLSAPAEFDPATFADAVATALDVAGPDRAVLDALVRATIQGEEAVLPHAVRCAVVVAANRPEVFVRVLTRLSARIEEARAAKVDIARSLRFCAGRPAMIARGREEIFFTIVEASIRVGGRREDAPEDRDGSLLLDRVAPLAIAAADEDGAALARSLQALVHLRATGPLDWRARDALSRLGRFRDLVSAVPALWRELMLPALIGQGAAIETLLDALSQMRTWVVDDDAVSLLKHVVTQEGVRAPEVFAELLLPGLHAGVITSLGDERETILRYLREVDIVGVEFYAAFRDAVGGARSITERRAAVAELNGQVRSLAAAIVAGAVPADREDDPLLGNVLFYVFPPSVSVTHKAYRRLFEAFPDHEPVAVCAPITGRALLSRGGHVVREGEDVLLAPWQTLLGAVRAVHAAPGPEPVDALGRDLFAAWIARDLAGARRVAFLERLYRRHHAAGRVLPESAESVPDLLVLREFLAESAGEIVQEALQTLADAEPERYRREALARLSPRPFVGPGLVRGVWRTVTAARDGEIDPATARERLARQLRGFALDGREASIFAALDRAALGATLDALPAIVPEIALGEEHRRVVQEIVGADLAAMQRELFGDGDVGGKLEYRADGGDEALALRFEVGKRRAHAPVGFCEGVCTASDLELWNDPRFQQCVIWGADGRARGGMHLLVTGDALVLPGVNPSYKLLSETRAEPLLEALLAFAQELARAWGLGALWLPDHDGILSNREQIRQAIRARDFPAKQVAVTQFSYRPFACSFDRVLVAWEGS